MSRAMLDASSKQAIFDRLPQRCAATHETKMLTGQAYTLNVVFQTFYLKSCRTSMSSLFIFVIKACWIENVSQQTWHVVERCR